MTRRPESKQCEDGDQLGGAEYIREDVLDSGFSGHPEKEAIQSDNKSEDCIEKEEPYALTRVVDLEWIELQEFAP